MIKFLFFIIAGSMQNFDVRVATDVIDPTLSTDITLCAHVPELVPAGQWMDIPCDIPIRGRYQLN